MPTTLPPPSLVRRVSQTVGWANLVSLLRMLLLVPLLWAAHHPHQVFDTPAMAGWVCGVGAVAIIWMDGLDGYLARKLGEASTFGAVWDILCDRVVEQTFWLFFLWQGWAPFWLVVAIIWRGVLVDGVRSVALKAGYTPFGKTSLMHSPLGVLLVSSRASRWLYAVLKAVYFSLLMGVMTPTLWAGVSPSSRAVPGWLDALMWAVFVCCMVRGLPVFYEIRALLAQEAQHAPPHVESSAV